MLEIVKNLVLSLPSSEENIQYLFQRVHHH